MTVFRISFTFRGKAKVDSVLISFLYEAPVLGHYPTGEPTATSRERIARGQKAIGAGSSAWQKGTPHVLAAKEKH